MAYFDGLLQSVREDDFVEYYLFPPIDSSNEIDEEKILNGILEKANKVIEKHTTNFLWHKDAFKLSARTSIFNKLNKDEKNALPPHLYGISHYGDNIEDEWFMVFILKEITKEISGLVGRIHDIDGEFLLIEAADYLPSWATPENCENRVYIYNGNIHLIPPDPDCEEDSQISVNDALGEVRDKTFHTQASLEIQNSIKNKLEGYPQKVEDNLYRANVFVPVSIAAILKQRPNLIAPAVQAFCNRDSIDVKACRAMKYFPPEDRVMSQVSFTKCLYAMLTHSKYVPDRRTGWKLPSVNSKQYKSNILGVKVACGFEILVSQAKPSADIQDDKGWHSFLKSLKDKGYFKGLLENSKEHNNLLNKAKEYYTSNRDTMKYTPAIGQEILELLKSLELNSEELKKEGENLPNDDDDSWLNIEPEELDRMLEEKYGKKKILSVNNNTDASNFTQKISNFLKHVSDFEGAEFPEQNQSPVRPPRKNKNKVSFSEGTKEEIKPPTNNKVNFDPNSFACAVQNILNFVIPEDDSWDLETDSDMSEYEEDSCVKEENYENVKTKMEEYMEQMDRELAKTTIGESFEKKNGESFDDIENFKPVDIDVNALKNILESYRFQMGEAGPSSNMLGPMGIHLENKDKMDLN